ncbi:hypothetical protein Tco_0965990 [Tanacetum coccineum]
MMTARKRVEQLLVPQLAVGYPVDHSSSDYFSPDDSARDSSSDSSSEASFDFHSDASSDSSLRHSLSDHFSPGLPSTSAGTSYKRRRSLMTSVPALSPVSGALYPVRANLIPSPKRVRDSGYLADVEVDPRETSLGDDVIVRGSDKPHLEQDIDPEIQADIDECIAYADALRDRGIDARIVVEAIDREESKTGTKGLVKVRVKRVTHPAMPKDTPESTQERAVEVTYETLGDLVQRIVGVESEVTALTERVAELERDNRRLRGTASVESQRVDQLQRGMSSEEMEAREAAMNLEPLNENGDEQEGENGGNGNGGNGGNGNGGNGNGGNGGNGNEGNGNGGNKGNGNGGNEENENGNRNGNHGTEGVVRLTRWFEKMETVFNTISVLSTKYQVKYADMHMLDMCFDLEDGTEIMEFGPLKRKRLLDIAYTQKVLGVDFVVCILRMVPDEDDRGYAAKSAENKRRMESNLRDNRGQQPLFKRQNYMWADGDRAYTGGNNKRKGYVGPLPYCNKCRLHHEGLCTMRYGNCKKVGHQTRDCRAAIAPNT